MAAQNPDVRPTFQDNPLGRAGTWLSRWALRLHLQKRTLCPRCKHDITLDPSYRRLRVCDECGFHLPLSVDKRITSLVDPHSFSRFRLPRAPASRLIPDWVAHPLTARRYEFAGGESVVAGTARIMGHDAVLVVFDFSTLGGTMGTIAGEAIARAFEYAAKQDLPVVVVTSTGGVRIQEGMPALLQMAKTTVAVQAWRNAHSMFVAVLAHPTTGGVYASFANLADIIVAEPGALIGFAGPRVAEAATGTKVPEGSHRAESLLAHGMVDDVVPRDKLRAALGALLAIPRARAGIEPPALPDPSPENDADDSAIPSAWETIQQARSPSRPTARDYQSVLFDRVVDLHGDRASGDDPAIVGGLAEFQGSGCVVIAQQRSNENGRRGAGPSGYRKAERLIELAVHLHLPIITLVDTPGADPSCESERAGIAVSISHCLAALLAAPVPTISVIIGEGTSGGALALAAADRVLMLENAVFSVISPEGASSILYGDVDHAEEMAERLGLQAEADLAPRGIVDVVIKEPREDVADKASVLAVRVKAELARCLGELIGQDDRERLAERQRRYRSVGLAG